MTSLEEAEDYVLNLGEKLHVSSILALCALRERFCHVLDERDKAFVTLQQKKESYSKNLQKVKLVSAKMIQEREHYILALKGGSTENSVAQ